MSIGDLSIFWYLLQFLYWLDVLSCKSFTSLVRVTPTYFILFKEIWKSVVFLISFEVCLLFVYRKATDICELIVYIAALLEVFISCISYLVEFFWATYVYYHIIICKWGYFDFFLSNLNSLDLIQLPFVLFLLSYIFFSAPLPSSPLSFYSLP